MKQVLIAFMLSVLCASCEQMLRPGGGKLKKTTRAVQGLNGPVRSVSLATAVPVDKGGTWAPGEQKLVSTDTYDRQGNRTEHVRYDAKGTVDSKIVFTYDAKGNEVEAVRYNAHGTPENRTASTYDAEGHRTESRVYAADGTLVRRTAFIYDARGNEIAARGHTPEEVPESRTVSTYDNKGNREETSWYYGDGKQGGQVVYRRDATGRLLSSSEFNYTSNGTLQSRTDATYDVRGNPTEVVWYSESGRFKKQELSTYQYDVFGNWTRRTTTNWITVGSSSSFEPPVVTYRTITYYGKGTE